MTVSLIIILIAVVSFFLALWSMRDLEVPSEILRMIKRGNIRGAIVFFKDKIVHLK